MRGERAGGSKLHHCASGARRPHHPRSDLATTVHLVFVTKYRRKAITSRVWEVMLAAFHEVCTSLECDLVESGYEPDHAHLLVQYPPKVSLAVLAQHLKGLSSRRVRRRRFPEVTSVLWGRAFWSPSYCAVSCGGAPLATVKAYVKAQQGEPPPSDGAASSPASAAAKGRGIHGSSTGDQNR